MMIYYLLWSMVLSSLVLIFTLTRARYQRPWINKKKQTLKIMEIFPETFHLFSSGTEFLETERAIGATEKVDGIHWLLPLIRGE